MSDACLHQARVSTERPYTFLYKMLQNPWEPFQIQLPPEYKSPLYGIYPRIEASVNTSPPKYKPPKSLKYQQILNQMLREVLIVLT